jgi:hypothetical protein
MRTYSRWNVAWSIGLGAVLASPAYAGWGQAKLISHGNAGVIAVDATGKSHIVYERSLNGVEQLVYTTYNTARVRGPLLSAPFNIFEQPSIAVDSKGVPHVAIVTRASDGTLTLNYLSLSGSEWQAQTVATDYQGGDTPLTFDAQDRPHIAYVTSFDGSMKHAFYDGSAWQFENPGGVAMVPTSIKVAKDGTVHIAGLDGSLACEERGLAGVWNGECIDNTDGTTAQLGFTADGSPEVAYIDQGRDAMEFATFDGTNWSPATAVEVGGLGVTDLRDLSFATDSAGFGNLAFAAFGSKHDTLFYAHQQSGGGWALTDLGGGKFIDFDSVSIDVDPAGLPHLAFWLGTPIGNYEAYGAETLAALTEQWTNITSATNTGKTTVSGTLQVKNFGTAAGAGFTLSYYLSADNQLDPSDVQIGHSTLAVGAGQQKVVKFAYSSSGPVNGEYLIAAIGAVNPQNEADTSNNVAVGQIP